MNEQQNGEGELLRGAEGSEVGPLADRMGALELGAMALIDAAARSSVQGMSELATKQWAAADTLTALAAVDSSGSRMREFHRRLSHYEDLLTARRLWEADKSEVEVTHAEVRAANNAVTDYVACLALAAAPLPMSQEPESEASEPAPEAAHTDQGAR